MWRFELTGISLTINNSYFPNHGSMMIVIKTARLNLRQLTIDDAENFYLLNLDPAVVRYTGDSPLESAEEEGRFLASYDQYEK